MLDRRRYYRSAYAGITETTWTAARKDEGLRGEYQLTRELERIAGHKRFLCNCYVPKEDGTTSEIDVLMITQAGIFVFEMKNYSGWIFGSQDDYQWTQVFPNKRKERFYNPLKQNATHVLTLQRYLQGFGPIPYYPIVVFGRQCTLKKVTVSPESVVLPLDSVGRVVQTLGYPVLTEYQVDMVWSQLAPLTQVSPEIKNAHIQRVSRSR